MCAQLCRNIVLQKQGAGVAFNIAQQLHDARVQLHGALRAHFGVLQ